MRFKEPPFLKIAAGGNPSLMSMLSVMVLTLAFFVVLNSISRVEPERSDRVLESIDATFGIAGGADPMALTDGALARDNAQLLRQVFKPMDSLVPDVARIRRLRAEEVEISFPVGWLFPAGSAEPSPTAIALFGEIRRLLRLRPLDWDYEMEVTLSAPDPGDIDFDRAASLASVLVAGDGPDRMAALAVLPRGTDQVVIAIRLRAPGEGELSAGGG